MSGRLNLKLPALRTLDLSDNQFSSSDVEALFSPPLPKITVLVVKNNRLNGPVPALFNRLVSLETLDIGGNFLSGTLGLGALTKLDFSDLSHRTQADGYRFYCPGGDANQLCTPCRGAPNTLVENAISAVKPEFSYPPPAHQVNGTVMYRCNSGTFSGGDESNGQLFNMTCVNVSGVVGYSCQGTDDAACQCRVPPTTTPAPTPDPNERKVVVSFDVELTNFALELFDTAARSHFVAVVLGWLSEFPEITANDVRLDASSIDAGTVRRRRAAQRLLITVEVTVRQSLAEAVVAALESLSNSLADRTEFLDNLQNTTQYSGVSDIDVTQPVVTASGMDQSTIIIIAASVGGGVFLLILIVILCCCGCCSCCMRDNCCSCRCRRSSARARASSRSSSRTPKKTQSATVGVEKFDGGSMGMLARNANGWGLHDLGSESAADTVVHESNAQAESASITVQQPRPSVSLGGMMDSSTDDGTYNTLPRATTQRVKPAQEFETYDLPEDPIEETAASGDEELFLDLSDGAALEILGADEEISGFASDAEFALEVEPGVATSEVDALPEPLQGATASAAVTSNEPSLPEPAQAAAAADAAATSESFDTNYRGRSKTTVQRSREARQRALEEAAKEAKTSGPPIVHPREWSFNDCVKWLKFHGFKEFVDTFYNNGFEGRQLVLLQVESFSSMRAHTRERCVELMAAIAKLKRDGSWVPPEEEDAEVNILAPAIEEETFEGFGPPPNTPAAKAFAESKASSASSLPAAGVSAGGTLPRQPSTSRPPSAIPVTSPSGILPPMRGRTASTSSVRSDSSAGRGRTNSSAARKRGGKEDTPGMERARLKHFLAIKLSRESCEGMLHHGDTTRGTYLVRESQRQPGSYVLSLAAHHKVHHFKISQSANGKYSTSNGLQFDSIGALIEHFKTHDNDGLPCRLSHGCRGFDDILEELPEETPALPEEEGFGFGEGDTYDVVTPTAKQLEDFKRLSTMDAKVSRPSSAYTNHVIVERHRLSSASATGGDIYQNQDIVNSFS